MGKNKIEIPPHLRAQMIQLARDFRKVPTPSEELLWRALRRGHLGKVKFRRQQPIGPFIVDFYCPSHRLIVEVDGPVHDEQMERDHERQTLLEACGYHVLRVRAADVARNPQTVLNHIAKHIAMSTTSPLSP
jgi:very-short-patch-repair endonuclease